MLRNHGIIKMKIANLIAYKILFFTLRANNIKMYFVLARNYFLLTF